MIDMAPLYERHPALKRVESTVDHRLAARSALVSRLPHNAVGAEIGVFTGVFSEYLIDRTRPREFWMVDAWDVNGQPAWNPPKGAKWAGYVDYGRLTYDAARAAATARSRGHHVVTAKSVDWLNSRPERSLDWVYLDTTHDYPSTIAELDAIERVVMRDGIICGDDAWEQCDDPIWGVIRAIRDFTRRRSWEIFYLAEGQFALRMDS